MDNIFPVPMEFTEPAPLRVYDDAAWDVECCKRELIELLRQGGTGLHHFEACERAMDRLDCWRVCVEHVASLPANLALGSGLQGFWMAFGIWSVPRALKTDIVVLADAMRRHLPPYVGPDRTLFRGQHEAWHLLGQYGIAWTESLGTATRLARRHSYVEGNAVALRAEVPAGNIIAPPTAHSIRIDEHEFIVDPRGLRPEVLELIPWPSDQ